MVWIRISRLYLRQQSQSANRIAPYGPLASAIENEGSAGFDLAASGGGREALAASSLPNVWPLDFV